MKNGFMVSASEGGRLCENFDSDKKGLPSLAKLYCPLD